MSASVLRSLREFSDAICGLQIIIYFSVKHNLQIFMDDENALSLLNYLPCDGVVDVDVAVFEGPYVVA